MIISQVIGGLGNQMFQYAMGRALSLERNVPFLVDVSLFENYSLHQGFELTRVFNCQPKIATENDIRRILGWQSSSIVRKILSRRLMRSFRRTGLVQEPHYHFWQNVAATPSSCYLQGYWQSEKYFAQHGTKIREDFAFQLPFVGKNIAIAANITQTNAVSLHVRRGDYASNAKTTAVHGLCSIEYYTSAIEYIRRQITSPTFFVFSDDIAWARENLKIEFPSHYIEHNQGSSSFNDMHLMSLCRHNIVANSSFSWWGAWLNTNEDKLVIAPKKWFSTTMDTKDLVPSRWTCL